MCNYSDFEKVVGGAESAPPCQIGLRLWISFKDMQNIEQGMKQLFYIKADSFKVD